MSKYYIHKDGRIYLVKKGDKLELPSIDEIPFEIEVKNKINFDSDVYFCNPKIDYFPKEWIMNDNLISRDDVSKEAKKAFIYSLCRPAVGGIILNEKNEVLMVYPNRGLTEGYWNSPGGFIEFGEEPKEALKRELLEETGYDVSIESLHNVYSLLWEKTSPGYYMICIFYILRINKKVKEPDMDEIESVKFMPIDQAIEETKNDFVKMALNDLLKKL